MLKKVALSAVPCLVLSGLVLSGCGVAGTQFNPGVAVRVGDRTITTDRVDELTTGFCTAVEDQVASGGQSFPLASFKQGIVGQLALQSATEQLAQRFDVKPGDDYYQQVSQIEDQAQSFDAEGRDDYVEIQSTLPYVTDVLTQIGTILLDQEGEDDPTLDFQQARGLDELTTWIAEEGVEFDPRYGLDIIDGQPTPVDTTTSFAASEIAQLGAADGDPDPNYVAALPLSATCG